MGQVSTYLNFDGQSEAALSFYAQVFGTDAPTIMRFGDMPAGDGMPEISEEDKNRVMHAEITILDGYKINASDSMPGFVKELNIGNNAYICLDPSSREEADRLFAGLVEGGTVFQPLQEQFWGGYFGELVDQFGIQWMFNSTAKS